VDGHESTSSEDSSRHGGDGLVEGAHKGKKILNLNVRPPATNSHRVLGRGAQKKKKNVGGASDLSRRREERKPAPRGARRLERGHGNLCEEKEAPKS